MKLTYTELTCLKTFEERLEYAKLFGTVGVDIFGSHRLYNQQFYHSGVWRDFRHKIIIRDNGCDLAHPDRMILILGGPSAKQMLKNGDINGMSIMANQLHIHHLNPILEEDLTSYSKALLDPENVICVSFDTHNEIHYGTKSPKMPKLTERHENDTCPWRKTGA